MNLRNPFRIHGRSGSAILAISFFVVSVAPSLSVAQSTTTGMEISQNQAANTASDTNSSAGQLASALGQSMMAAGQAMMPSCCGPTGSCCGAAQALMAMGALAMLQGMANSGASDQQAYNGGLSAATPNTPYTPTTSGGKEKPGIPTGADAKAFASKMNEFGAKYDTSSGKVKLPNGKTVDPMTYGSAAAAAGAGVSSGDYKQALDMAKKLEAKLAGEAKPVAVAAGGGMDAGSFSGGGSAPVASAEEEMAGVGGAGKPREPASVAGMVKNYNGESIGVSGDNIFEMMARRYREKSDKDNFLPPESSPESLSVRN